MNKPKKKFITLEGTSILSNPDLVKYFQNLLEGEVFKLTQKPKVQVAQPVKP